MSHRILVFVALLFTALSGWAQQGAPVVTSIEVQYAGPATISKERILANMRTSVGKPYNELAVEEDIRNLYATGNLNNVRIFGEAISEGKVKVIVVVQPKSIVSEIAVAGADRVSEKRIRKDLASKVGDPLNESGLEQDRQKILTLYTDRNFADAAVTVQTSVDEKAGTARVTFTIMEGGKSVIHKIFFEGSTEFKEKELRKTIQTKPHSILSILTKSGKLQSDVIDQDVLKLKEKFQNAGFVDVVVNHDVTPLESGNIDLNFRIAEGRKYSVGKIEVSGAAAFTTDEVRQQIRTAEGATFSPGALRSDVKRISDLYGTRGYVDLQIFPETTNAGPALVNISIRLDEGSQSYVERVNISGNTRTKDKVIRREMAVTPGEVYNTVLVDASRARLQNLQYFERVETYPGETLIPGRKDINIVVDEKRTGSFNFGAGFSSIDSLLGFVEVQQSNFDITRPWSFTGGGQRFRSRIQYGTQRKDFILSLTEPYFMDYKFSLGAELFYREASYVSDVYSQGNAGISFVARRPVGKFSTVRLEYRLENVSIDMEDDVSEELAVEDGDYLKSSLNFGYTYETLDSLMLPRKGEKIEFNVYVAGGPLAGDVENYGFNIEGSKYFLLPGDTILSVNGELGSVDGLGGDVPIFDRLFLGGANDLRGFRYRDVSPVDVNGEPVGGQTMARFSIEYTFPVVDRVRGAVFYDVGFVNRGSYDFNPSELASDVGLGVRLELPIGPVRIDYGIPLQGGQSDGSGGKFNFNVGYKY